MTEGSCALAKVTPPRRAEQYNKVNIVGTRVRLASLLVLARRGSGGEKENHRVFDSFSATGKRMPRGERGKKIKK